MTHSRKSNNSAQKLEIELRTSFKSITLTAYDGENCMFVDLVVPTLYAYEYAYFRVCYSRNCLWNFNYIIDAKVTPTTFEKTLRVQIYLVPTQCNAIQLTCIKVKYFQNRSGSTPSKNCAALYLFPERVTYYMAI